MELLGDDLDEEDAQKRSEAGEAGKAIGDAAAKSHDGQAGAGAAPNGWGDEGGDDVDLSELTETDVAALGFAERPMAAEGYAMGSRPMWKHPAFSDMTE